MRLSASKTPAAHISAVALAFFSVTSLAAQATNGDFDETFHYLPPDSPSYGDPEFDPLQPVGWRLSPYDNFPVGLGPLLYQNGAAVVNYDDDNVLALRNRGYASTSFDLPSSYPLYSRVYLSWQDASRVDGWMPTEPLATYQVLINGAIAGEFTPVPGSDFTARSLVIPTSKWLGANISFVGMNLGEVYYSGSADQYVSPKAIHTVYIDDVQWNIVTSPVPEPSMLMLMLAGLPIVLGTKLKRRLFSS